MKKIELNVTNKTVVLTEIYGKDSVDPLFEAINEANKMLNYLKLIQKQILIW